MHKKFPQQGCLYRPLIANTLSKQVTRLMEERTSRPILCTATALKRPALIKLLHSITNYPPNVHSHTRNNRSQNWEVSPSGYKRNGNRINGTCRTGHAIQCNEVVSQASLSILVDCAVGGRKRAAAASAQPVYVLDDNQPVIGFVERYKGLRTLTSPLLLTH